MPKINTANLSPNLEPHARHQVYNGLDCCITFEIFEILDKQLQSKNEPFNALTYQFERGMQAPALEMMERGWLVDEKARSEGQIELRAQKAKLQSILDLFAMAVWQKGLNPNSPAQLKKFFYEHMGLPEQHNYNRGQRSLSTNREALEKLWLYFYARPIINVILKLREITKQLSVLETEVSSDGRMRTSYNVAGTETGRWSSSSSADGSGTNLQNITPALRRMFIADPGWKLCYLDLEQAESRVVGLLVWRSIGDAAYLDACESGDLHTTVCKLVWPGLGWTGDDKADKQIANQPFYRHFTYRDMAKRGGHGTNYYGTPRTMARHLKVEEKVMVDFQKSYFKPFSGIRSWHEWVSRELAMNSSLTTLLGRKRIFYGRPGDDATLREAIAFEPQSVVGDLLNCALWRVWAHEKRVQILGQVHDAIIFQYKTEPNNPDLEADIINSVLKLTQIPIIARERELIIPSECMVGWNWSKADANNPLGLVKWTGQDARRVD